MTYWIKFSIDLFTHPKILQLADLLAESRTGLQPLLPGFSDAGVTPRDVHRIISRRTLRDLAVTAVVRVWCAANRHTVRGEWRGVTLEMVDDLAEIPGFGSLMEQVGWVKYDPEKRLLKLPNFLKYNVPAKVRAVDENDQPVTHGALRMRRLRDKRRAAEAAKRDAASDAPCDGGRDAVVTHRREGDGDQSSPLSLPPRRRERAWMTRMPDGWPTTEAAARSMAEAAGVPPEMAVTYWNHYQAMQEWPPGPFASVMKSKAGFQADDLARDMQRDAARAETRRRHGEKPVKPVTDASKANNGW